MPWSLRVAAFRVAGSSRTMTDLEVGQLLPRAVESSGINGLASGK